MNINMNMNMNMNMNTDVNHHHQQSVALAADMSPLSSMGSTEPMDCNSTPNASPAHVAKSLSSNEDVAMSENTSVSIYLDTLLLFYIV